MHALIHGRDIKRHSRRCKGWRYGPVALVCRVYEIVVGRMVALGARTEIMSFMLVSWVEKWKEE
jgi:hypothetical protein